MDEPLTNIVKKSAQISKNLGLGESTGRVLSILIFAEKPITQDEIKNQIGNCTSLVSTALNHLNSLNFIEITKKNQKKHYELKLTNGETYIKILTNHFHNKFKEIVQELEKIENKNENINMLIKEHKIIDKSFDIMKTLIKFNNLEKIKKIEKHIKTTEINKK